MEQEIIFMVFSDVHGKKGGWMIEKSETKGGEGSARYVAEGSGGCCSCIKTDD